MKQLLSLLPMCLLTAVVATPLCAQGPADKPEGAWAYGKVIAIDANAREVKVALDSAPGHPMAKGSDVSYIAKDAKSISTLKVGDPVQGRVSKRADNLLEFESLTVTKGGAPKGIPADTALKPITPSPTRPQ